MDDVIRMLMDELSISEPIARKYLVKAVERELWIDRQDRINAREVSQ